MVHLYSTTIGGGNSANGSNSGGGGGGSGGGGGGGGSGSGGAGGLAGALSTTTGKIGIMTMATVAASVAIAAMMFGNRRAAVAPPHPLHGMIKKRIGLFSNLAERNSGATTRPEASSSDAESTGEYQLA